MDARLPEPAPDVAAHAARRRVRARSLATPARRVPSRPHRRARSTCPTCSPGPRARRCGASSGRCGSSGRRASSRTGRGCAPCSRPTSSTVAGRSRSRASRAMLNGLSSRVEYDHGVVSVRLARSARPHAGDRRQRPHARAHDVHPPRVRAGRRRPADDHVLRPRAGRAVGGGARRQPRRRRGRARRDAREPARRPRRSGVVDRARRAPRRHRLGREPAPARAPRRRPARQHPLRPQRALPAQRARHVRCSSRGRAEAEGSDPLLGSCDVGLRHADRLGEGGSRRHHERVLGVGRVFATGG